MEQKEPSMEEILSSIRRILSHEEEVSSNDAGSSLKATVSTSALDGSDSSKTPDVMELTADMRIDEGNFEQTAANVEKTPESLDDSDSSGQSSAFAADDMELLSEEAVQASRDQLSHLVQSVGRSGQAQTTPEVKASGSLEDLVSSLLRPYLKEWLDAHLPEMVERVVQKEVQRLTQKVKIS